jgi:hypothetical protein
MCDQSTVSQTTQFCHYVVAYVDVLSQKDALSRLRDLPETAEGNKDFIRLIQESFGAVRAFRRIFRQFHETSAEVSDFTLSLPEEARAFVEEMRRSELSIQQISDGMAICVPLAREQPIPIIGVYEMLSSCSAALLLSMRAGQVYRGGIDIGIGGEIEPGEIYGSALSRAYHLESQIAQYPRIVIGDRLIDYLMDMLVSTGDDPRAAVARSLAERCLNLLTVDIDGWPILHYMGESHRLQISDALRREIACHVLPEVHDFLVREAARLQIGRNTKLAFRYSLLSRYFEANMAPWCHDVEVENGYQPRRFAP